MSVEEANGRRVIVSRITFAIADLESELRAVAPNMASPPRLVLDETSYWRIAAEIANHAGVPRPTAARFQVGGIILEYEG